MLKLGVAAGVTPPKVTLGALPDQIKALIKEDAIKSPVLEPFTDFPSSIPPEEQTRLREEAVRVFNEQVRPSLQKLHDYVAVEYLPKTRETVGWSGLPNGEAWYAYRVRSSTTTDLSPEKIHEIGLSEVKRIRGEMDKIIAETKFKGGFKEFLAFLRTDPQFYYDKPEELLAGFRDIAKRIDPELAKQFGVLPRLTYGVKPIPDYSAKSSPAAYYFSGSEKAGRPGWFVANTYALKSRPKWQMECLTLHEAVPGHHLQISLAQEDGRGARSSASTTATPRSSRVGALCREPRQRPWALQGSVFPLRRIVVRTLARHPPRGGHRRSFQGLDPRPGAPVHERDRSELRDRQRDRVEPHIVWPAQALAYKIGELKIRQLRNYAQGELGKKFDIRAFHDTVLANGALPLDTLETVIKEWVQAQKQRKLTDGYSPRRTQPLHPLPRRGGNVDAVKNSSFTLESGESLALVGESGSGKSVTALALTKLLPMPPAEFVSGEILFEGEHPHHEGTAPAPGRVAVASPTSSRSRPLR